MNREVIKEDLRAIRKLCDNLLHKLSENHINILITKTPVEDGYLAGSLYESGQGLTLNHHFYTGSENEGVTRCLSMIFQMFNVYALKPNTVINFHCDIPINDIANEKGGVGCMRYLTALKEMEVQVNYLPLGKSDWIMSLTDYMEKVIKDAINSNMPEGDKRDQGDSRETSSAA